MRSRVLAGVLVAGLIVALGYEAAAQRGGRGCGGRGGGAIPPLLMETDAFPDGGIVPERYAGRGGNIQPGFTFSNIPDGAVSFAIIFHDLDVALGGRKDDVLHWLAWNIPASAGGIPEGSLPNGSVSGTAGVGRGSYFGPGAPAGPRYQHYVFELYALSEMLDIPADSSREALLDAMQGKIVGKSAYFGRSRQ